MKLHIIGICGTFMGSLALLAKALGHEVHGCDENVYPPISTQLAAQGIELTDGFSLAQLDNVPDLIIIGNTIKRGNPLLEFVLNQNLPFTSGPQWLAEHVLKHRWVLGIAGTHGKTTTSSMLAWILEYAGLKPGFLIGGIPENFSLSARLGKSDFFVIEADEYDSAFFDKRSKFIHYHPRTLILNNLEYDHADIFPDLAAIQTQFHHLVRTLPSEGLIIAPKKDDALQTVLKRGCWTPVQSLDDDWRAKLLADDGSAFECYLQGKKVASLHWNLLGQHNVNNALAAIAAAHHVGISPNIAARALEKFKGVKRRMQLVGEVNQIKVYDDFAHHPTAIATTLAGLRAHIDKNQRIIAIVELGSNTMRSGIHDAQLIESLSKADLAFVYRPQDAKMESSHFGHLAEQFERIQLFDSIDDILGQMAQQATPGDHLLVMSNRGFEGIHQRLINALKNKKPS